MVAAVIGGVECQKPEWVNANTSKLMIMVSNSITTMTAAATAIAKDSLRWLLLLRIRSTGGGGDSGFFSVLGRGSGLIGRSFFFGLVSPDILRTHGTRSSRAGRTGAPSAFLQTRLAVPATLPLNGRREERTATSWSVAAGASFVGANPRSRAVLPYSFWPQIPPKLAGVCKHCQRCKGCRKSAFLTWKTADSGSRSRVREGSS